MNARAPIALLAVLLAVAAGAPAQDIPLSSRLSYRDITVSLRDGTVVRGRLIGATKDSIVVRQSGEDKVFAFPDLRKVLIKTEARPSEGVAPGIALGLYIGNGLLTWAPGEPGFYLQHIDSSELASGWLLLGEAFFAAVGAGAGWIAASGGGRQAFEFPTEAGPALEARERFLRFLAGEPPPARVHFLIQSGFLVPGSSAQFKDFMDASGYTESYWQYLSTFSGMRGLELSVSVKPRLRAGLRLSFPSEPAFDFYYRSDPDAGFSSGAIQEVRATAVHGIGAIELIRGSRAGKISLSAGLGAGIAGVRLFRQAWTYVSDDYGGSQVYGTAEVRKTLLSGVVFGALQFPLTRVLSIGLAADYTLIPAVDVPALPDNGLAGQTVRLSNGSVGFVLGYHF
ncbi:MAG: hypothetical protein NTX99_04985 [Candidatus Aminicenantes bacterium]|nr:hypothetical protein [Candidatus Aminicenantes bacterium]